MNHPARASYLDYWGKAKPEGQETAAYHRLAYHSLDVAACAHVLLRDDEPLRARLASAADLHEDCAAALAVYLAALHDAGKLAPSFQLLVPDVALELRPDLARVLPRLELYSARHDSMGFVAFDRLWSALCERGLLRVVVGGGAAVDSDDSSPLFSPWVAAVTGHHGKPPTGSGGDRFDDRSRADLVSFATAVAEIIPVPTIELRDLVRAERQLKRSSWLLAGLAVLADWIGSNQHWFPYRSDVVPLANYWGEAIAQAERAVAEAGVMPCRPRAFISFSDSFPDIAAPSPLQQHVAEMPLAAGPQLVIVEESTGAGKTEAALALARRLMAADRADGMYIALPTMATANGMHARLTGVARAMFDATADPSLVLAHSATAVRRLLAEEQARDEPYSHDDGNEEETASLQCTRWLGDSRKKAMLAHVGVGTVDQALLGVLPSKHSPLRLLGLHRKVLVVDEVHAYDAYVARLLERLLEFHAALGGSAVLLSATLPARMRRVFQGAFERGLGVTDSATAEASSNEYPLVTHVSREGRAEQATACRAGTERGVGVAFLDGRDAALAELTRYRERGGCVVWIRNTIADALDAYEAATARFGSENVTLFHGRFALADRIRIEDEVLRSFGKGSGPAERAGRIVIATQVVEQSLDIDFDGMVTDLAPIDLLIQRAGRLCRHPRSAEGNRTAVDGRGRPTLHIVAPPWADVPDGGWLAAADLSRTRFVYPHLGHLWLTQRLLRGLGAIRTPDDARALVEGVYGDVAQDDIPEGLRSASDTAEGSRSGDASLARMNAVALNEGYMRTVQQWLDDTRTPTRLGEETTRLRLARLQDGEVRPLYDASSPWLAWHLSEVSVGAKYVIGPTEGGRHAEAVARAVAEMPDEGKWSVTVLLESDGEGAWRGEAQGPKSATQLRYSVRRGLEVGGNPGRQIRGAAARLDEK